MFYRYFTLFITLLSSVAPLAKTFAAQQSIFDPYTQYTESQKEKDFEEKFWGAVDKYLPQIKYVDISNEHLVLVVGNTGAGKSTTINAWLTHKLRRGKSKRRIEVEKKCTGVEVAKIGHSRMKSETTIPKVYTSCPGGLVYTDCAGKNDSRGSHYDIFNMLLLLSFIKRAKSVKAVVCIVQYADLESSRGKPLLDTINQLSEMIQLTDYAKNIFWVFTKCPAYVDKEYLIECLEESKSAQVPKGVLASLERLKGVESSDLQQDDQGGFMAKLKKVKNKVQNTVTKTFEAIKSVLTENEQEELAKWARSDEGKLYVILEQMLEHDNIYIVDPLKNQGSKKEIESALNALDQNIPKEDFHLQSVGKIIDVSAKVRGIFLNQSDVIDAYERYIELPQKIEKQKVELESTKNVIQNPALLKEHIDKVTKNKKEELEEKREKRSRVVRAIEALKKQEEEIVFHKKLRGSLYVGFFRDSSSVLSYDDHPYQRLEACYNERIKEVLLKNKPTDGSWEAYYKSEGYWDYTLQSSDLRSVEIRFYVKKKELQKVLYQKELTKKKRIERDINKLNQEIIQMKKETEKGMEDRKNTLIENIAMSEQELEECRQIYDDNKNHLKFICNSYPSLCQHQVEDSLKQFIRLYQQETLQLEGPEEEKSNHETDEQQEISYSVAAIAALGSMFMNFWGSKK